MQMMTVWFIVLVAANGHRIELPGRYDTDKECYAAAAQLEQGHRGSTATCIAQQVPDPRGYVAPRP
jgi:hypothetical protein